MEIDRFFIKEKIDDGILELSHVNSCNQVACNLACNKMGMIDFFFEIDGNDRYLSLILRGSVGPCICNRPSSP